MTRYNDTHNDVIGDLSEEMEYGVEIGYREGVDRVLEYIVSIHRYEGLVKELHWAIREGII